LFEAQLNAFAMQCSPTEEQLPCHRSLLHFKNFFSSVALWKIHMEGQQVYQYRNRAKLNNEQSLIKLIQQ